MFKLRICHKPWIVLAPIHHCQQQESRSTREPVKFPARIVPPWGLSVVSTHPQSPGFLPAKCVFGRWQHPSPSTVLQGSSGEGVGSVGAQLPGHVHSLWPHGLLPARLLCAWDFPARNTGVGSHAFLRDIPNPGIEPAFPSLAGRFFTC